MQLNLLSGESLQAVMSGAAATTNPKVKVDYLENGVVKTAWVTLAGATDVTLLAGAEHDVRIVTGLSVSNEDSAAVTITINHVTSVATYRVDKKTLAVDDTLVIDQTGSPTVTDVNGQLKLGSVASSLDLADDAYAVFGTDDDVYFVFSTSDASNPTFVLALDNTSQQFHITDKGAVATDWNIAAVTHPTVYVHSNTTPATDYVEIGGHDGTTAHIDVRGGTTLLLMAAGNEIVDLVQTASSVNGFKILSQSTGVAPVLGSNGTGAEADLGFMCVDSNGNELLEFVSVASATNGLKITNAATGDPVMIGANGTGATANRGIQINDSNGNELVILVSTASAVNGIRIVNAATGNNAIFTNEGEADTGITIAGYDGTNTEEICEFDAVATAVNGWKMAPAASGSIPRFGSNGTGAAADTGFELVDSNGNEVIEAVATASAVNGIRVVNSATGVMPIITNEGEADTGLVIAGYDGTNTEQIVIFDAVASAVNELTIKNAVTGGSPEISATGDDTDINITLTAKGAGFIIASKPIQDRSSVAVTATTGGGTTGLIPAGSKQVVVTSDDVNKQISLPVATIGDEIWIEVGATGCELISAVAAHKVNNVTVGATNEATLTATSTYWCRYRATNEWIVIGITNLGAIQAALVPDAL